MLLVGFTLPSPLRARALKSLRGTCVIFEFLVRLGGNYLEKVLCTMEVSLVVLEQAMFNFW